MNRALHWFAMTWGCLVLVANIVAIAGFLIAAPTFWAGMEKVWEIYSPFNVFNWIAEFVAILPALGALYWLEKRESLPRSKV